MHTIRSLGIAYFLVALIHDIMDEFAYEDIQSMKQEDEEEAIIIDIVVIFGWILVVLNTVFYCSILDALTKTIEYFQAMKQTSKLKQYIRLRWTLLISLVFGFVWAVVRIVDMYSASGVSKFVTQEQKWIIDAAMELNYAFVLIIIAILWRPQNNSNAYPHVMELPAHDTTALSSSDTSLPSELPVVVPSATDDLDDYEHMDEDFHDE